MQKIVEIQTSFDKKGIDNCSVKCLTSNLNSFNFLTPKQVQCFTQCTQSFNRERFYSTSSIDSQESNSKYNKKSEKFNF